jgi:hypothetical protein
VRPYDELTADQRYTATSMALSAEMLTVPPLLPRAGVVVPGEVQQLLRDIFDPARWNAGTEVTVQGILDVLDPIRQHLLG